MYKSSVSTFIIAAVALCMPAWAQSNLSADAPVGIPELIAHFDRLMPTGVAVSKEGRIFVNFPRWGDAVEFTVAEMKNGHPIAYPNQEINVHRPEREADCLVSVQSVIVDPANRLWLLDTGSIKFGPTRFGGPKMICVDLATNKVIRKILLPPAVALRTTYLNDVRFDLQRGGGFAYITDSSSTGPNGIIVVDLRSGKSWRKLHNHPSTKAEKGFLPVVEGKPLMNRPPNDKPSHLKIGSDGIALSADKNRLFYCPLASRKLYSVPTAALINAKISDRLVGSQVVDHGDKGGAADGMETDPSGDLYITNYEHNAILRRKRNGEYETVVHSGQLLWPDTLAMSNDGWLYFTVNQLHRQPNFNNGHDRRQPPYALMRVKTR